MDLMQQHPYDALDATLLRLVLRDAVRAPSSHNTQPWLFHVEDGTVELWADRSRSLAVADPNDRELTMSCGAALHHLRIAMRKAGYAPEVEVLAEPHRRDLLARVSIGRRAEPSKLDALLADAIERRHTNRGAFEPREIPPQHLIAVRDAAEAEGANLVIVPQSKRHELAKLVAEGDRRQWHDSAFRRELAKWLRGNHDEKHRDGMPGYALGMSDAAAAFAPLVVRTFDRGDGVAAHDAELVEGAQALAVLFTSSDTPRDWMRAGQALSHLLLRATTLDLAASFLNQPIEVKELRPAVAALIDQHSVPQLILRLGFPVASVQPTPRRAVDDVLR